MELDRLYGIGEDAMGWSRSFATGEFAMGLERGCGAGYNGMQWSWVGAIGLDGCYGVDGVGGTMELSGILWSSHGVRPYSHLQDLFAFLAQPNALLHLDLASTDCALDVVRGCGVAMGLPWGSRGADGPLVPPSSSGRCCTAVAHGSATSTWPGTASATGQLLPHMSMVAVGQGAVGAWGGRLGAH